MLGSVPPACAALKKLLTARAAAEPARTDAPVEEAPSPPATPPPAPDVKSSSVTKTEIANSAAAVAGEKEDPQDSGHAILGSALVVGLMTLVSLAVLVLLVALIVRPSV